MKTEYIIKTFLFALLYIFLAKAGLLLALDSGFASVVWPGSGLALCLLLIYGNNMWLAIAIGAFFTNFINGGSFGFSTMVGIGNTLEALAAYNIIKYFGDVPSLFTKLENSIRFILASFIGSIVSAAIGSFALSIFHKDGVNYIETFGTWWLGDLTSFLIIVPMVMLFKTSNLMKLKDIKIYLSFIFLIITCFLTFFRTYDSDVVSMILVFSMFIFPLIASLTQFRFSAILHVFIIALFAVIGTIFGKGPFVYNELNNSLIILQSFISVLMTVTLIVSVGIKEKDLIEEKLSVSLFEKDVLISEIHHRVKNNLSVVSSLLYLQGETILDEETRKKIAEMQSRIKTIALVHEKLYKESNIKTVEFSDYIKTLAEMIQRLNESTKERVKLLFDLEKNELSIEKALPLGLILNEIITNSYKHAFTGKANGEIALKFIFIENKYYLAIRDNGVGFKNEKNTSLDSLGLILVETLSDQIEATYSVKSENGTTYEFWFK